MKVSSRISRTGGCPLNFLQTREHHASKLSWEASSASTSFLSNRLDKAHNLYRRDLFAHFGCVNAIEFSQEGCLLISGGDDRRVLLWNLESSMSRNCKPVPMKEEHSSNIFCLGFDSSNSKIFSAGNDEQVIVHDVKTRETVNVFMHEEAIYGVSVNPYVDSVFASAGEDGQILLFDIRAPLSAEPLLLARSYDAFHAVQFHPVEPMFVVTANSKEGVVLWDVRKPRMPFVKYGDKRSSESSMCARFNSSGTQIIALRRRMYPVLFNTHSSNPVCEFDADHYYNSCTMKSCCFAGSRDQFVLSGSDDFNLYMWRIPDPESEVSFISEAHLILKGHRSIVNQVRFNVHNFTIASSGVEKIVKLWSPMSVPGSCGTIANQNIDSHMTRRVYTHEDYIGLVLDSGQTVSHDYSHGSTDEDPKMMAFFDSLVQREVEGWTTNTDLSDDDGDTNSNPSQSSSSMPSSQSDTDSDNTWTSNQHQNFTSLRRRRSFRLASRRNQGGEGGGGGGAAEEDRRRRAQGSEWILKLIAKKRAQLKAAKKKRKRSSKKKFKSKARQFIRCFTSSRQYLYRPENNRASTSNRSNHAAPADLLRRRHMVAPYTMMSLGHWEESEDNDSEDDTTTDKAPPPPPPNRLRALFAMPPETKNTTASTPELDHRGNSGEARLWSSDSNSSEDEGINISSSDPLKEGSNHAYRSSYNNVISDLVESDDSNNKGANSISISSQNSELSFSSNLTLRSTLCNRSDSIICNDKNDENLACCNAGDSLIRNQSYSSEVHSRSNTRNVMPISGVSTDETGSVMFVSNQVDSVNQSEEFCDNQESMGGSSSSNNNSNIINDGGISNNSHGTLSLSDVDRCASSLDLPIFTHLRRKRTRSLSSELSQDPRNRKSLLNNSFKLTLSENEELQLPTSPEDQESSPCDDITNGAPYHLSANTPDSGISVGDRGDRSVEDSSSELDRREGKQPAFRKKKIPEYRMKSYRPRISDEEGEEN